MRVLIGCERSGVIRRAFRERGHDAWSCDLVPADDASEYHLQCDVFDVLDRCWDLMIFHWPCTYLTRAGAGWLFNTPKKPKPDVLYGEARRKAMIESAYNFKRLLDAPIPRICGENPIPYRDAAKIMGKYSQKIQPYEFGHPERKGTCLWLRHLPPLIPTKIVPLPEKRSEAQRLHYLSPSPERARLRSISFKGIGEAMADQWGGESGMIAVC